MEKNKIDALSSLLEQLKSGKITKEEFEVSKNNLLNPSNDSNPENEIIYPNNNNLGVLGGSSDAPLDKNNFSSLLEKEFEEAWKSIDPYELNPEFSNSVSPKKIWQAGKSVKSIYRLIVFLMFVGVMYTIVQNAPQVFITISENPTIQEINSYNNFMKKINTIYSVIQFFVFISILTELKNIAEKLMKSSLN